MILSNDSTVRKEDMKKAISILRGEDEKREIAEGLSRRVMSREEAAKMLNVSRQTVSRWGRQGKITPCRNGKKTLGYSYESVMDFFASMCRTEAARLP